ncbi:hypothetical protein HYH03_001499 [Edaphochlamys debaryana]|uniref:Uncharacterized protein n=1 Tax=Edaphochlamys debaryana TaxID=47281 RepID=A0A835YLH5_9CHLO|nr:hypothetical protein HYH03_001499 [Edaphochlamys debaryana]|eukprot:KAG2500735.1 hypothetical protein HYH03_001499 [Edaphochlamys debaryana]
MAAREHFMPTSAVLLLLLAACVRSTNQFAAELIAREQVMASPNRVSSFEEADVVYIPTFLGLMVDVGAYHENLTLDADMRALGQAFTDNLATLLPRLKEKPHFLVGSHEALSYKPGGVLTSPLAPYLTLWAIELWVKVPLSARSLMAPRKGSVDVMRALAPGASIPPGSLGHIVPMPYASYVHYPPVVFDQYVLDTFPFAEVLDPSRLVVYVPRSVVNATNVVDYLNDKYPDEKRKAMLAHVLSFKHVFQWSLSSDPRPLRWDELGTASPHDDAFSMLLKRTVEGGCRRGLTGMRHCELLAAAGGSRGSRARAQRRLLA